jgi:hypothetical protein
MEYTIKSLLEYIEIWDEILQIEFSNSIYKIFYYDQIGEIYSHDFYFKSSNENLLFTNIKDIYQKEILKIHFGMKDIVNPIIKFLMKIISLDDKNVKI